MCHIILQSDNSIFLNVESLEDGKPKYKYFVGYKKFTLNTREKIFRLEPYSHYQSGQQFEAKLFEDGIRLELENVV